MRCQVLFEDENAILGCCYWCSGIGLKVNVIVRRLECDVISSDFTNEFYKQTDYENKNNAISYLASLCINS